MWDTGKSTVRRTFRRGFSVVYVGLLLIALIGFVSLAVDIGRVRLARAQVQDAADAAAHSGARSLPNSQQETIDAAYLGAEANPVIDQGPAGRTNPGLVLDPDQDIDVGIWDPANRVYTMLTDNPSTRTDERRRANAVHVIGRRIQSRGDPVPLIFAPVVGIFSSDVQKEATAYIHGGGSNFGFIGIDWVDSNGNGAVVDSMIDSINGGQNSQSGGVASDGNINLINGDVYGDARPGEGDFSVSQGPNSIVTGWMANLDYKLADIYTPVSVPPGAVTWNAPTSGDWLFPPAGVTPSYDPKAPLVFKMQDMTPLGNTQILVKGFVAVYVTRKVKVDGFHITNDGEPPNPSQFSVYVVGAGTSVDIGGNDTQYMHLYAPESTVTVHGGTNMQYYGWIVGKTLSFIGSSNLHYDDSNKHDAPFHVTIVR